MNSFYELFGLNQKQSQKQSQEEKLRVEKIILELGETYPNLLEYDKFKLQYEAKRSITGI